MDDDEIDPLLEEWLGPPEGEMVDDVHVVNGADREPNGTFGMVFERRFYADGRRRNFPMEPQIALAERIRVLCESATCGRPFEALESIAEMRRNVDRLEYEVVALARSYGWAWRDVATALGVSTASAHRRFAQWEVYYRHRRSAP